MYVVTLHTENHKTHKTMVTNFPKSEPKKIIKKMKIIFITLIWLDFVILSIWLIKYTNVVLDHYSTKIKAPTPKTLFGGFPIHKEVTAFGCGLNNTLIEFLIPCPRISKQCIGLYATWSPSHWLKEIKLEKMYTTCTWPYPSYFLNRWALEVSLMFGTWSF